MKGYLGFDPLLSLSSYSGEADIVMATPPLANFRMPPPPSYSCLDASALLSSWLCSCKLSSSMGLPVCYLRISSSILFLFLSASFCCCM